MDKQEQRLQAREKLEGWIAESEAALEVMARPGWKAVERYVQSLLATAEQTLHDTTKSPQDRDRACVEVSVLQRMVSLRSHFEHLKQVQEQRLAKLDETFTDRITSRLKDWSELLNFTR